MRIRAPGVPKTRRFQSRAPSPPHTWSSLTKALTFPAVVTEIGALGGGGGVGLCQAQDWRKTQSQQDGDKVALKCYTQITPRPIQIKVAPDNPLNGCCQPSPKKIPEWGGAPRQKTSHSCCCTPRDDRQQHPSCCPASHPSALTASEVPCRAPCPPR